MTAGAQALFEPLTMRGLTLRNRIVMPPIVSWRPHTSDAGLDWYGARVQPAVWRW